MPSSARPYESYRSFLHAQANRRPDGGGSLVVYFFSPNSSANAANFGIARSSRSSGTQ